MDAIEQYVSEYRSAKKRLELLLDWAQSSPYDWTFHRFGNRLLAVTLPEGQNFVCFSSLDWLTIRAEQYYKIPLSLYSVSIVDGQLRIVYKYYARGFERVGWN